jgi:hypothetical protein
MILSCACSLVSSVVLPIYLHINQSRGQLRVARAVQRGVAYGADDGEAAKKGNRFD